MAEQRCPQCDREVPAEELLCPHCGTAQIPARTKTVHQTSERPLIQTCASARMGCRPKNAAAQGAYDRCAAGSRRRATAKTRNTHRRCAIQLST